MVTYRNLKIVLILVSVVWSQVATAANWRVVNGSKAKLGQFPFMASIPNCSASIIGPSTVLTAGHCVCKRIPAEVTVGVVEKTASNPERQVHKVASHHIHPKYAVEKCTVHPFDTAVLRLKTPIQVTQFASPIAIKCDKPASVGTPIVSLGYGLDESKQSGTLRFGRNKLSKCYYDDGLQICSSVTPNHVLHGDSGGPVVTTAPDGTFQQIGVNSGIGRQSIYAPTFASCDFITQYL